MKTKKQMQDKLNELIEFADSRTPEDRAKVGAMLLSAGGAFMYHAGVEIDSAKHALDLGYLAAAKGAAS